MPPGGYQFSQPEIGWVAPHPLSEGINLLARRVRDLRRQVPALIRLNLPTDLEIIEAEIVAYNCHLNPKSCVDTTPRPAEEQSKIVIRTGGGGCGGCG